MISLNRLILRTRTYVIVTLIGTFISFSIGYYGYKFLPHKEKVINKETTTPNENVYNEPTSEYILPTLTEEEKIPPPKPFELMEYDNSELLGFPIYPNSTFINKTIYPRPKDALPTPHFLYELKEYNWSTTDDFDAVVDFYENKTNISGSGWSCLGISGERGGPRDGSGGTTCNKGEQFVSFMLMAAPFEPKNTSWQIEIYKDGMRQH